MEKAPLFLRGDAERNKLRAFIKQHVKHGDNAELLYRIEKGRIRPSKMLADSLVGMLRGNQELSLSMTKSLSSSTVLPPRAQRPASQKQVVIVKGGPERGKSVVAINLIVALTKRGFWQIRIQERSTETSLQKAIARK